MFCKGPSGNTLHEQGQQTVARIVVLVLKTRFGAFADPSWGVDPLSRIVMQACVQYVSTVCMASERLPAEALQESNFGTLRSYPSLPRYNRAGLRAN